jgi:hypothetical protein
VLKISEACVDKRSMQVRLTMHLHLMKASIGVQHVSKRSNDQIKLQRRFKSHQRRFNSRKFVAKYCSSTEGSWVALSLTRCNNFPKPQVGIDPFHVVLLWLNFA